jgi:hypothetical protein
VSRCRLFESARDADPSAPSVWRAPLNRVSLPGFLSRSVRSFEGFERPQPDTKPSRRADPRCELFGAAWFPAGKQASRHSVGQKAATPSFLEKP